MNKIAVPEPAAWMLACQTMGGDIGWKLSWHRSGAGVCHRLAGEVHEKPLITTTQAEAYKDACVREALEEAARACESRIRTGDPGVDTTEVDIEAVSCAAAIRALIPSTPARPESEQ